MPSNIIVTEVFLKEGCRHGRVFRVPIDPKGETTCNYRSRVSLNSFFSGKKKRNYKKDEILYHSSHEHMHDIERKVSKKFMPDIPDIEYIEVDSIWSFYKLIGFDNKTKKWETK